MNGQHESEEHWPSNYFNYFTEAEDHFRKARGTGLFLLSPVDWALLESWKNGGIPLEAVLRGIDAAFEKWRKRPGKFRQVNSLAYCTQAVMEEAAILAGAPQPSGGGPVDAPFTIDEVRAWLERNAESLRAHTTGAYGDICVSLSALVNDLDAYYADLEELERRLTALEDKMGAMARATWSDEQLLEARRELEIELRPYRGKMSAPQLAMLEKQYLDRKVLEAARLPRLSLFYLG
jgi:hypothetical protein